MTRESRLPIVKALIEEMGLEAYLEAQVSAVRTRPVPMKLVQDLQRSRYEQLTPAEVRILSLLAQGLTRREVANILHVSVNTIKTHLKFAFLKLKVHSISHALARATELGYLE